MDSSPNMESCLNDRRKDVLTKFGYGLVNGRLLTTKLVHGEALRQKHVEERKKRSLNTKNYRSSLVIGFEYLNAVRCADRIRVQQFDHQPRVASQENFRTRSENISLSRSAAPCVCGGPIPLPSTPPAPLSLSPAPPPPPPCHAPVPPPPQPPLRAFRPALTPRRSSVPSDRPTSPTPPSSARRVARRRTPGASPPTPRPAPTTRGPNLTSPSSPPSPFSRANRA
ncbi:atherin-like [Ischnura elegans]|uniref:atherin-like n=1 Tax=Ischnura elegans TaxID=197161 RepID=UPI001ED8905E|nr:atherin-like [Ischnura elegans]